MYEMFQNLSNTFWDESVWTPPNSTWKEYENYRQFNDIYYSAYTAVVILLLRFLLDRYLYTPVGIWMGLAPNKPRAPSNNPILEKSFRQTRGKLTDEQLTALAKQSDLTERQIQRWMRLRCAQNRPTVLSKFTESAWRCTFYSVMFIYGIFILWNKPWFWDSVHCYLKYPHHYVGNDEWWYYNMETAFYLSLLVSQFFDVQRKDFWVMFTHHVVTLCLLFFSWACNLVRAGTLVLVIHDFADIPLEGAKMMAYLKKQGIADIIFNVFAFCWIISRIGLLPYRIIYYSSYVALTLLPMYSAYYIFNGLLVGLQTLHIIWTYFIIRVAIQAWNNNGIKDIRSEEEDNLEDEINDDEDQQQSVSGDLGLKSKTNESHLNGDVKSKATPNGRCPDE